MEYRQIKKIVLLISAALLVSCEYINAGISAFSTPAEPPPFVITRPVCEIDERPGYYRYAGIAFNFMNTSSQIMDEITVSFIIYDSITNENPFIGSNRFMIKKLELLLPNENKEILISLDKYIYLAPQEPYLIDFFYVSKIHFTDDTAWEDLYGLYKID